MPIGGCKSSEAEVGEGEGGGGGGDHPTLATGGGVGWGELWRGNQEGGYHLKCKQND